MNTQPAPKRFLGLEEKDFFMPKQFGAHLVCLLLLLNYSQIMQLFSPLQIPKAAGIAVFFAFLAMAILSFLPLAMYTIHFYIHQIVTLVFVFVTGVLVILNLENSVVRYLFAIFSFESAVYFVVSSFYLRYLTGKLKA